MSAVEDFLAEAARESGTFVREPVHNRPLIVPKGAPASARAPYQRASSFAERFEDHRHIYTWEKRYLAQAMGKNRDLADLAAGEEYVSSKLSPDVGENRASGKRLDSIIARALDREGIHFLADRGTAYHSFCQHRRRLHDGSIPPEYIEGVRAYWDAIDRHGLEVHDTEVEVACDELGAAGTFDSLVFDTNYGIWRIGDIKTGDISLGYAIQEVSYARAERYNTDTDERAPLLTPEMAERGPLDLEVGLLFKVIPETVDKPARCEVIEVDLVEAWEIAQAMVVLRDRFTAANLFTKRAEPKPLTIMDRIGQAQSGDELQAIWRSHKTTWNDQHSAAAKARLTELEAS